MKKINRHIIIAGTPRSGKTTLCLELQRYGFTHYKMDTIKRIMCELCKWDQHDWNKISPKVGRIINAILKENKTDTVYLNEYYAIDTCHLLPGDIKLIEEDALIIYLGYKDIRIEEKVLEMKKYDKKNYWSNNLSDVDLYKMVEANINLSKFINKECKKYNIKYFDTSYNRELVLKEIIDFILEECTQ